MGDLYPTIHRAYDSSHLKVSPAKLTQILNDATDAHQPPMISGKRIKIAGEETSSNISQKWAKGDG